MVDATSMQPATHHLILGAPAARKRGLGGSAANRIPRSICLTRLPFPVVPLCYQQATRPYRRLSHGPLTVVAIMKDMKMLSYNIDEGKRGGCSMHAEAAKNPSCLLEKWDHWPSAYSNR